MAAATFLATLFLPPALSYASRAAAYYTNILTRYPLRDINHASRANASVIQPGPSICQTRDVSRAAYNVLISPCKAPRTRRTAVDGAGLGVYTSGKKLVKTAWPPLPLLLAAWLRLKAGKGPRDGPRRRARGYNRALPLSLSPDPTNLRRRATKRGDARLVPALVSNLAGLRGIIHGGALQSAPARSFEAGRASEEILNVRKRLTSLLLRPDVPGSDFNGHEEAGEKYPQSITYSSI
ncbi:hypothetical protein KM043_016439 [Ampulex compressa]|nr:hypothetical protein KM043_016439 [Ampulex compressa]